MGNANKWPAGRLLALGLPLLVLAVGCEDTPTGLDEDGVRDALEPGNALLADGTEVTLGVEGESFAAGAPVTLVLDNQSSERIGFNLCFHDLERRADDEWTRAEEQQDRVCTLELQILNPGGKAEFGTHLPEGLPSGQYRYRVALYLMDRDESWDQASEPFQVGG